MKTRRELLELHNNDYGFDPQLATLAPFVRTDLPSISVVIPYHETGNVFGRCLYFLSLAIQEYGGYVEVIVIDDGSVARPASEFSEDYSWLEVIRLPESRGRTDARNAGLELSKGELVLFLDSDVLVDNLLIVNHVKLHLATWRNNRKAICVSFFEFTDTEDLRISSTTLVGEGIELNDFRLDCVYESTWIGCEDDRRYVGQHMRLVEESDFFKAWKGLYKVWMLPNMVLGGAFSVSRLEIMAVGGFDRRFKGYGFTETSAVTRMIAEKHNVLVPCLSGGALHVEDKDINLSRLEKDVIFKKKHDFYFNTFLMEPCS